MIHNKVKYIPLLFLLCILSGSVLSCYHSPNNTRLLQQADTLINEHPDSALQILNRIILPKSLSKAEQAQYALLLGEAHLKTHRSLCEDSLLTDALAYYEQQQDTLQLQRAYLLTGCYLHAKNELPKADSLMQKALILARLRNDKQGMLTIYEGLASVNLNHNVVFDYDKIKKYMHACMELESTPQRVFYYGIMMGFTDNDSIHYYCPLAIRQAISQKDSLLWNYLLNYASYLTKKKRYKDALKWLLQSDFSQIPDSHKKSIYLGIARAYLFLPQIDSAQVWLQRTEALPFEKDLMTENTRIHMQGIIDYIRNKHVDVTYIFRFNDSVQISILDKDKVVLAKNEAKHHLERQNLLLKLKNERILWGATLLIILIIGVALYIGYRRKRSLLTLQQQLEENRSALMTLHNQMEEKSEVTVSDDRQKVHELRLQKIDLCKKSFAKTTWSKKLAAWNCNPEHTELTGEESNELTETLTRCFVDVLIDLKQDSPKLNSAELTHIIFLLLGCSNRTISMCTFAAESTIRTRKVRIKEKLSEDYQSILFT